MAHVTAEERAFYGSNLVLLEGIILEFLSCLEMIRRYQTSLGRSDPVSSHQARIKQAASMREKLRRQGLRRGLLFRYRAHPADQKLSAGPSREPDVGALQRRAGAGERQNRL